MINSSNTIDYSPLQLLIGRWEGNKGTDLAPEPEGEESTPSLILMKIGTNVAIK